MLDIKTSKRFVKSFQKIAKNDSSLFALISNSIDSIRINPQIGDLKRGDLKGIRCLDIYHNKINYELAYTLEEDEDGNLVAVLLLLVGTRENFYKELRRLF